MQTLPFARLNGALDRLARTEVRLGGATCHAFHVCGVTGFLVGSAAGAALAPARGLSPWIVLGLAAGSALTSLALAMLTKIVTGVERLVYYHHQIAIVASAAIVLRLLHRPALPYLDVTVLGVGLFLVGGRVGCLMVGCCHGRPHRLGVRYRREHAEAGFPACLVGVRLFPVQIVESLGALGVVAAGVALLLGGAPPGAVLAWYAVAYALGRFLLEFARGDGARPYLGGFSEAQWISLAVLVLVAGAEGAGWLPRSPWHLVAAAATAAAMIGVAAARGIRRTPRHRLLHARHIEEIAEAVARASGPEIRVARTSLGIKLSASTRVEADGVVRHYALSREGEPLTREAAATLARLIRALAGPLGSVEIVEGGAGIFHVLHRAPDAGPAR